MFKKPKSKEIVQIGKGFAALEVGKRVGRGVSGATIQIVKPKDENQAQIIKAVIAGIALYGAASYKGKNQDLFQPGLVGIALEEIGDIIDLQAAKHITKKPNPDPAQKFLQDAMGLGCPCNMTNDQMPPEYYPMLASPAIREIEWETVWDGGNSQSTSFTGV